MVSYRFVEWKDETGAVIGTTPSITLFINRDKTLTAVYEAAPPITHNLTIEATPGGTTNPAPGTRSYPEGSTVTVTAIPGTGYMLDHWELDGTNVGAVNPITIIMDKDHTLRAIFSAMPPGTGILEVHAYANTTEVAANVEVVGIGTYTTPFTMNLTAGTYTLNAKYNTQTQTKTTTITEGQTTIENFYFKAAPVLPKLMEIAKTIMPAAIGAIIIATTKRRS
jgi:hypothetical protein